MNIKLGIYKKKAIAMLLTFTAMTFSFNYGLGYSHALDDSEKVDAAEATPIMYEVAENASKDVEELKRLEEERKAREEAERIANMGVEEMIKYYCDQYNIPSGLTLAISRLETGHWKSDPFVYGNNVGGLSDNEVPRTYSTLQEGVIAYVECLSKYYYGKGLYTPEAFATKYNTINPNWASTVRSIMYSYGYDA